MQNILSVVSSVDEHFQNISQRNVSMCACKHVTAMLAKIKIVTVQNFVSALVTFSTQ